MSKRLPKLEVYPSGRGWRWRMFACNGRNIANGSEAYSSRTKALDAWERVAELMGGPVRVRIIGRDGVVREVRT